jgi:four helix bundle protein
LNAINQWMRQNNIIQNKSFDFAFKILKLYSSLVEEKKELVISRQILKSGTSIGANVEEALGRQSDKDFLSKISIAYKEARETKYWLKLIKASQWLEGQNIDDLQNDCEELLKILGSIQISVKKKIRNS